MTDQNNTDSHDSRMQNIFASSLATSRAKAKQKWQQYGIPEDHIAGSILQEIDAIRGFGSEFKKQARTKAFDLLKGLFGGG